MKKLLLPGLILILVIISCEKTDNEVFFKIGSKQEYKFSDIELYDSSAHMLYFKREHDEFKKIETGSFSFLDRGDLIYSGSFWPGYSSLGPSGPFISSPMGLFDMYAFKIENWHGDKPDVRNDSRLINALKRHDLLHSGLAIISSSIIISGTQLTFRFTLANKDQSDLLIIDPEKTGPALFHYFTNGLYIYDLSHNEVFSSTIQHESPDPWNSWKTDWLSELKSGESREFVIIYTINNPIIPGEYDTSFEFPGLAYQVTKDQLYQGNSRIWLGGLPHSKRVIILP
jgi:hypothetical protein